MKHEILNKLQTVRITWFKLLPYWKASDANVKWKLRIFDAVIRAKLLYGLETVHLTEAMLNKIDAFQIRGLRKILNLPSTFIDRRFTNRYVLRRASDLMSTHGSHENNLLFSHCYIERRAKLLGHIARTTQQDPLRQISFQPNSVNRVPYGKKRHGRPRQNWLHYTKKIYTMKKCISLTMKRPFKRMHVYSMQPMLDTFNKAGTFGYAYALLPLLTCRRSRVGQQKKKQIECQKICQKICQIECQKIC